MKDIRLGLTYNDVLVVPKRTSLNSRREADVRSRFSRNIALNVPFVSANMATVTEDQMAIAMARNGGLGIIHQFLTIEEQAEMVRKVKRSTSYVVDNPLSVKPSEDLKSAITLMKKHGVGSLVVQENFEIEGILTHRDYQFHMDDDIAVSAIMTPKDRLVTAPKGVSMHEAKRILHDNKIEKLPIIDYGKVVGLITRNDIEKLEAWPNALRDDKGRLRVGAAIGVKDTLERAEALVDAGCDVLVLDIAHCHSDLAIKRVRELKAKFQDVDVVAGNIATGQAAEDLIEAGADGLKVGIGPSPVCTTRIMSGAGVPQITATMDVYEVAKLHDVPVITDGGMKYPGDCVKAIAAGASCIFSGTLFAGCDEAPGFVIVKDGKRYKRYMGSASYQSNHERKESLEKKKVKQKLNVFVEGVTKLVNYKGSVDGVIDSLVKGVKSGISYCGCRNLLEMHDKAEFIRITPSGWTESLSR